MAFSQVKDFGLAHVSYGSRNSKRSIGEYEADLDTGGLGISNAQPPTKKTSLAFRSSPKHAKRPTTGQRKNSFMTFRTQVPTPVESSEDELYEAGEMEMEVEVEATHNPYNSDSSNASSILSTKAQLGDNERMDLGNSPPMTQNAFSSSPNRRRKNLSLPDFASIQQQAIVSDRIPTPMVSTFDRSSNTRFPFYRTTLSPHMGGRTPDITESAGPPSPDQMDVSMSPILQRPDRMMNGLNISSIDDRLMSGSQSPTALRTPYTPQQGFQGFDGQNEGGQRRRVYIGYRADCEKCRLKVPGHYNHLI